MSKAPTSPASDEEKESFLVFLDLKLKGWKNLRSRLDELERKEQRLQMKRGFEPVIVPLEKPPPELQKPLPALPSDDKSLRETEATTVTTKAHMAPVFEAHNSMFESEGEFSSPCRLPDRTPLYSLAECRGVKRKHWWKL